MDRGLHERFGASHIVDTAKGFDASKLQGKTAIITGGASGIGEASVRGFVQAGAFVAFSDISKERGDAIEKEFGPEKAVFVQGDVTNWSDQKRLFKTALEKSPSGSINVVFANAAIVKVVDDIMADEVDADGEPLEPNLDVAEISFRGVLLTAKLALHYFRRQLPKGDNDHCLILTASVAGYWDHAGTPQYGMSKWAVRGLFRSLRSGVPESEIRVNILAPWFLRTNLISQEAWDSLRDQRGVILAEKDDAAKAVLHLSSDQSIHGRSLMVVPREAVAHGYVDADRDSHEFEIKAREEYYWKSSNK